MDSLASTSTRDETSLRELIEIVWRDKWIVMGVTLLFVFAVGLTAWLTPRKYTATVILAVVSNRSGSGMGGGNSILSQFGGIASLAGLPLRGDSEKSESIAVLQSQLLTMQYIKDNNLLPILFAPQWDAANRRWKSQQPGQIPTLWRANARFNGSVRDVTENSKTGLITLTITWTDAHLAAQWANDLVRLTNDYMRDRAIQDSERNIAFLNEQAAKTDIAQVRAAIYAILESEIRRAMLARGADEYALKVLDPAVPPEIPSAPKRAVWVIVGFLSGLFVSVFLVFARESWTRSGRT